MPRKKTYPKHKGVFESRPDEYSVRFTKRNGKRATFLVGPHDKAVQVQVQELHSQAERFRVELPSSPARGAKFSAIAADAEEWYEKNRKSINSFCSMVDLAVEQFGNRYAEFITPQEFEEWLCDVADERDWATGTRNHLRSALITIYREAMRKGKVVSNPAKLTSRVKAPLGRVRFLSKEEEERLRSAVVSLATRKAWDWQGALWQLEIALHTGMRKGEQFGITWDQVDLANRNIHLDKTKNGSSRYIRLNSACLAVLCEMKARQRRTGAGANCLIFSITDPSNWFDAAVAKAGIQGVTWHTLRHTFASRLVMLGVPLRTVQILMGHKSITMTARYAHLAAHHKRAAVELLVPSWSKPAQTGS